MADNSTSCPPVASWVNTVTENAKYFTYEILPYPYLVLGIAGQAVFFVGCLKKSKKEPPFLYQTFLSGIRLLEIVSFTLLTFAFNRWAGLIMKGAPWFQQNYACMWYAAHLCIPMVNGFINTSLFLTLCIAIDRIIAITKPHIYRQINQEKKYKISALCLCLLIGFGIVAYDTGRFYLTYSPEEGLYFLHDDVEYVNTRTSTVFIAVRITVLILGVTALWVANFYVIRLHRIKMVQVGGAQANAATKTAAELAREEKRKEVERTLLLLMLCQGIVNGIAIGSLASWYMSFYLQSDWLRCTGIIMMWAPMDDAGLQIAALLDFYIPLLLSKSVKRMIVPKCGEKADTAVPASSQAQSQPNVRRY